jgi:response regulator RpfG family c-di-GMP phosphodiesterase
MPSSPSLQACRNTTSPEVLTATDGEKGCEMALSDRPDIILTDLEMTFVDGWEATRRLKGNPETRDIPVTFCPRTPWRASAKRRLPLGTPSAKATGDACLSSRCRRSPAGSPMAA